MNPPRFSVVLPCYNEAETLQLLFDRFREVVGDRDDIEVVFVNNGSKDQSAAIFARETARPEHRFARVVTVPENRGYGFGIMSGLRECKGELIGWTHADSQYDPAIVLEGFARLAATQNPRETFLQGRRTKRPLVDVVFTAGMSVVASLLLGVRVSDVNAQPKLFHRRLLHEMSDAPDDFSLDLYALVLARRGGYAIERIPVVFGARRFGEAKGGGSLKLKWKLTKRTWTFILKLRRELRAGKA